MKRLFCLWVVFLCCLSLQAQDPRLFENSWFLSGVTIEGEFFARPEIDDNVFIEHSFTEFPSEYKGAYCDRFTATLSFSSNGFDITETGPFLTGNCVAPESYFFENQYLAVLYTIQGAPRNPFVYSFVNQGSTSLLSISNPAGDILHYSNMLLATNSFNQTPVTITPNPVNDQFSISIEHPTVLSLYIYNVMGREMMMVSEVSDRKSTINVRHLPPGIYFLRITTKNGAQHVVRFSKR